MKARLVSYTVVYVPPYPLRSIYAVGVVENEKGEKIPVRIEQNYIPHLREGLDGEIVRKWTPFGEIDFFIPKVEDKPFRKVALVTGASRGIGRATVLKLASIGYDIALNDLELTDEGKEAIKQIESMGRKAVFFKADVSKFSEVQKMVDDVIREFGRIDVLVNNAGINIDRLLINMTLEEWQKVIDVNLNGVFNCTKAVLPYMIKQGGGHIINISSMSALIGAIGQANYAAAKGGIISFTKVIAREYAKYNILCNAIAPGAVKTRMLLSMPPGQLKERVANIPLGRIAEPEEVAELIAFLAETTYITGQVISINAGEYV
ncbi:MAG: 3-oxoacyl-ACP reductase FabG [Candidatus Bathyarchaeia archaeon]